MIAHRWPFVAIGAALAGALLLANVGLVHSAPQQVPGFATPGATSVQVVNQPSVLATQQGDWRVSVPGGVALAKGTSLGLDGPDFLEAGRRYKFQWGGGQTGVYAVVQVSRGWALVRSGPARLWINTALAIGIEEVK
jgi:hypothetical protein